MSVFYSTYNTQCVSVFYFQIFTRIQSFEKLLKMLEIYHVTKKNDTKYNIVKANDRKKKFITTKQASICVILRNEHFLTTQVLTTCQLVIYLFHQLRIKPNCN